MAKKNKQKTFTRTKSPEQQEIELIIEKLEEERTLHALEVEEVPIRLSAELNDLDDYIHLTTTNKTKFVICTLEVENFEIFSMIDNNIQNLLKQAKECYTDYSRMRLKYMDKGQKIIKKNIPDDVCFRLEDARDQLDLQDMGERLSEMKDFIN